MTLRIKEDELELVGIDSCGSEILHYKGKPFTGIMFEYEDAGWLSYEIEFQDGFQEGWVKYYYENGKIKEEYYLHNNVVKDNTFKKFDENGNIIKQF